MYLPYAYEPGETAKAVAKTVANLRNRLAGEAMGEAPRALASILNDLAEAIGAIRVIETADLILTDPDRVDDDTATALADRYFRTLLTNRPGDTSSGRTNDVRRAETDGTREATRLVLAYLSRKVATAKV